jgi:Predicted transcriptional regulators
MSSRNTDLRPAGAQLGNLLRHWRSVRGRNQLDLSIETGISQRHISFIESGRSKPSRQTLLEIAQVLDVPLRERNALLLSAGFAPVYSRGGVELGPNAQRNQSAGTHPAPARAFPGSTHGSILECADDE